jgi:hypothetical protein
VSEENYRFLLSISRELGNSELYLSIFDHFQTDFKLSAALGHLCDAEFPDFVSDRSIAILASDFFKLPRHIVSVIPIDALLAILCHPSLRVASEDALYSLIVFLASAAPAYFDLLPLVQFKYLSAESISNFIELSSSFESISHSLWISVCDRLRHRGVIAVVNPRCASHLSFPLSTPLDGIISYLTRKHGGNVHDLGLIEVTVSSIKQNKPEHHGKQVLDFGGTRQFSTGLCENPWICFDFKAGLIFVTYYTMVTDHNSPGWTACFIRSWVVEVSLDGIEWTEVDRQTNCPRLNGAGRTAMFAVQSPRDGRFLRVRAFPVGGAKTTALELKAIEFFGVLADIPCE